MHQVLPPVAKTKVGKQSPDAAALLTIIQHHRENQTPLWFHENVETFDTTVIFDNCSDIWIVTELLTKPKDTQNNRNSRTRLIHVMSHRILCPLHGDIKAVYSHIAAAFAQETMVDTLDLYWETEEAALRQEMSENTPRNRTGIYIYIYIYIIYIRT